MDAMVSMEKVRAETRAMLDHIDRVARNHPDWGLYYEGDERPKIPWWKHLLRW